MEQYVQLGVLGLASAAAYSLLSSGLILIYRASGVLNFAQGAMATVGAYLCYELTVNDGVPYALAAIFSVVVSGILSALIYLVFLRPLRRAALIVRLFATLAVLSLIQAAATLRYSATILSMPAALPSSPVSVGGVTFPQSILWLIVIAAGLAALLHFGSRATTFGLATLAVAENETTSAAVGWSPAFIATVNWGLGGGLAAVAGILITPVTGLSVLSLTFLVIPAMSVALLGRFSSFGLAFLGSVILGAAQGATTNLQLRIPGISDLLTFALIIVVLIIRRQALPSRGEQVHRMPSLGTGSRPRYQVAALLALGIAGSVFLPLEWVAGLEVSVTVGIIIVSLVVVTGFAGQLSLGQYALAGIGALVAAQLVAVLHWPFLAGLVVGVLAAGFAGVVFGLPSLRSRGATAAIVTLGFGLAIQSFVFANPSYAGGGLGFTLPAPDIFGWNLSPITHLRSYTLVALLGFALSVALASNLRRGQAGRRLAALRANERAAASLGINVSGAKLYVFIVSAALAGLGGVLLAFGGSALVLSQSYTTTQSISAVLFTVVGGAAHVTGAVFGGELVPGGLPAGVIANHLGGSNGGEWLILIGAVVTLVTLRFNPDGIASTVRAMRRPPRPRTGVETDDGHGESAAAGPASRCAATRLDISGLSVRFGNVEALKGVDLRVASGEIVGLIGPNGAGKTTLIDAVTGYVRSTGNVRVGDQSIIAMPAYRRARAGVTRSFQSLELFDDISVEDNLRAASDDHSNRAYLRGLLPPRRTQLTAATSAAVAEFRLSPVLGLTPKELSYGQRRLVGIARAVATAPSFLLLDEPAAGLSDAETEHLGYLLVRLAREWNIGILLIEHDMNLVMGVCDRVAVLEFGAKIAEGAPAAIQQDPTVIEAYLGTQHESGWSLPETAAARDGD